MSKLISREEIGERFGQAVASDEALVSECMKLCQMFDLSVESLLFKWEAFSYTSHHEITIFTLKSAVDLKAQLQRELIARSTQNQQTRPNANSAAGRFSGPSMFAPGKLNKLDGRLKVGAIRPKEHKEHPAPIPSNITITLQDPHKEHPAPGPSNTTITLQNPRDEKRSYRYMYEKILERSEVLDDRIDEFAGLVQKYYNIEDLGDPGSASEEVITVVGRIVLDAETSSSGAKLNEASLLLESSRMMGSGTRIPIRFQETKIRGGPKGVGGIGLFPGAIVAARGKNGGGGCFVVEELLTLPRLKPPPLPLGNADSSLSMCIACGPFTPDTDLEYQPFHQLIHTLKSTKPAIVLLIGPFIDSAHPYIRDGEVDRTPKEMFQTNFIQNLHDFLNESKTSNVLMVPSIRDIISDHNVFPQSELDENLKNHPQIHFLSNPCRFSLNGISFAVSSVDVLFHLRKNELFKRGVEVDPQSSSFLPANDPMSNLCRHILQQRSFYPIFPVPLDLTNEVNLDISHSEGLKLVDGPDPVAPDVLIVPSRLKHFSKVVDDTVAINPSFLSKGTYATVSLDDSKNSGSLVERAIVDLNRLS